jgi:phosphate-selective porin
LTIPVRSQLGTRQADYRARLGIEADMFKYYEFRLLPDFSNGQTPGNPAQERIQDAYLNVHYWNAFQVEAGKFKQPFSYEQLIQDRFVPTNERSLIDQLVPARDEGVMIHGYNLFYGRFDYQVAVSNGEINGDEDTNELKDLVARVAVRPFNDTRASPPMKKFLHARLLVVFQAGEEFPADLFRCRLVHAVLSGLGARLFLLRCRVV